MICFNAKRMSTCLFCNNNELMGFAISWENIRREIAFCYKDQDVKLTYQLDYVL